MAKMLYFQKLGLSIAAGEISAATYRQVSVAYADNSFINTFDGSVIGKCNSGSTLRVTLNDIGKSLFSFIGKKSILYFTRRNSRTAPNETSYAAFRSLLNQYCNTIDVIPVTTNPDASRFYTYLYDPTNSRSYFCPSINVYDSSGKIGADVYIPIYNSDGSCLQVTLYLWSGVTDADIVCHILHNGFQGVPFITFTGIPFDFSDPGTYTPEAAEGGGQEREPSSGGTVGLPSLPTISALGTGLLQLYNPSKTQLVNLGRYLWSNDFNLDNLKKLFSNPMDVILGLSIFPVTVPTFGAENIMLGNLDSGVSANTAAYQYVSKSFGTLDIDEYYSNYLDYDPYTRIEVFLPYIGFKDLSPDEVMGKTLALDYSIDLLSGACVAHIRVDGKLTYEFSGVCNTQIPITSQNYNSMITGTIGIIGGAVGAGLLMASGMGAAASAAGVMSAGMKGLAGLGASTAASVMSMKHRYEHSGNISSAAGYLAGQTPYVMIITPRWCKPGEQPHFTGYPGFLYRSVSQLDGFTIFVNLEVTNIHCTQEELDEIIDWFTNKGVRI